MTPEVTAFFDDATNTVSFVVKDPNSANVAIVDSVLDFDFSNGRTDTASADEVIAYIQANDLKVEWILESHVHADHLSAAPYIQQQVGGKVGIGANITIVQEVFGKVFNEGSEFQRDGSQFDKLFVDGDTINIGTMKVDIMHTPGHTPACMTYVVGDAAFVGDTMFMPDFGTARCDFPGGSAEDLYASIQKILALPDQTRIFVGHDYKAPGRDDFAWETTVAEQRMLNVHVGADKAEEEFVKMRAGRDAQLSMPKLIVPSIQINMRAGRMPEPEGNGKVYLKVPVNTL
ncbi:MBL fold metallo-hydrolase [Rhodobacterales bacterium 52_120_T64]|nr:MBL fold metallo-hydrolase [Rhodobacterales bacterium 52_120_T64]